MYAGDVVRVGVDCALISGCDMVGWWGEKFGGCGFFDGDFWGLWNDDCIVNSFIYMYTFGYYVNNSNFIS